MFAKFPNLVVVCSHENYLTMTSIVVFLYDLIELIDKTKRKITSPRPTLFLPGAELGGGACARVKYIFVLKFIILPLINK